MKIMEARALLLDMDGTLVQSGASIEAVWGLWCERHGVPLQAVLAICQGMRSHEVVRTVASHLDVSHEVGQLDALELQFIAQTRPIAGAPEFLRALDPHAWAMVTSASRQVARQRLGACQLDWPAVVVGSDDVARGKPDPEPYRTAAVRLGVAAGDCIAFEDAAAGVYSALAAGCRVVQVGTCRPFDDRVEAVIPDWRGVALKDGGPGRVRICLPIREAVQ